MTEEREGCAFVMNVSRLLGADGYVLAPGYVLRRARSTEVAFIKNTLKSMGIGLGTQREELWEMDLRDTGGHVIRLPEQEWRYFVIACKEVGEVLFRGLKVAFDLAPLELEVGFAFSIHDQGYSVVWESARLFHVLENRFFDRSFFVDVAVDDLAEITTIYAQVQQHDNSLVNIEALAQQLGQLKSLPHHSPLRFLGYFAVLESLLTHAPQPKDPYDSITRQVKKKLALLNRRFLKPIDYAPFGETTPDKIWRNGQQMCV